MNPPTHIIDPDGEVIIILQHANAPFAPPDDDMIADVVSDPLPESSDSVQSPAAESGGIRVEVITTSKKGKKKGKKKSRVIRTYVQRTPSPIEESASANVEEPTAEEPTAEEPTAEEPTTGEPPLEEPPLEEPPLEEPTETGSVGEPPDEDCFRIQVSAKHLILASSVFKKTLTGGWKESITYLQKGSVEITTESWDIDALLILLRAIHGQYYCLPRKLTLEMLAKVAVLIDYYKCNEAVSILTDVWVRALEERIPTAYSRDLILSMWVSWFFQLSAQFKESTSIAMSCSAGWINSLGLPIPNTVIESMNERRQEAIQNLVLLLHETRDALLTGHRGCDFECSSIMYGALTKQMQSCNLLSPRPAAPFPNLKYKCLVQQVLSFKSPQWRTPSSYYYDHNCSASSFTSLFEELDKSPAIKGLDLYSLID
ncbi:hypothetical protein BO78DRAFT_402522 [Aspergillus sclerotiicarbonarius CBS 121057]|uniref:BTB domain-containing protein n=1 Tax=Aspergillus sclerotiicarbonarius (strain CBS 121057 / IBT 28362) TaxID=1448318 RepID=A0A319EQX9_ASPSB|nr:hypothetical protein BO78DRAFT_402522 [Aspergillus sclerotiicarbonarius CBS 121057]